MRFRVLIAFVAAAIVLGAIAESSMAQLFRCRTPRARQCCPKPTCCPQPIAQPTCAAPAPAPCATPAPAPVPQPGCCGSAAIAAPAPAMMSAPVMATPMPASSGCCGGAVVMNQPMNNTTILGGVPYAIQEGSQNPKKPGIKRETCEESRDSCNAKCDSKCMGPDNAACRAYCTCDYEICKEWRTTPCGDAPGCFAQSVGF